MRESDNEAFDSQQPRSRKRQAARLATVACWPRRADVRLSPYLTGSSGFLQATPALGTIDTAWSAPRTTNWSRSERTVNSHDAEHSCWLILLSSGCVKLFS